MTCDQCGNELVGYGLQIRATARGGLATFHDEHWNGGDFCSLECASGALHDRLPRVKAEPKPEPLASSSFPTKRGL